MGARRKTEAEFWAKVAVAGPNECWPYLGNITPNGYGRLRYHNRKMSAHKLAFELKKGPVTEGLFVCHSCDNKPCCNPMHLYAGTPKQNSQDAKARGRLCKAVRSGSHNGNCKLGADNVKYIRDTYRPVYGEVVRLAKRFGVTDGTIRAILKGRAWKHLEATL